MPIMTRTEIELKAAMGRKVYFRKNGTAAIAKYYSSHWWWPWDWYCVLVADAPKGEFR